MRYEFHPEALDEYEEAARYFAGCQIGLELRFIACVESAFREVSEAPTRWHPFEEDVRRISFTSSHTRSSTRLSPVTCSSSPSCTVAVSRVIGVTAFSEAPDVR